MATRFKKMILLCLLSITTARAMPKSSSGRSDIKKVEKKSLFSRLWPWSSHKKTDSLNQDATLNDLAINNAFDELRKLMKNERVKMVKKVIRKVSSLVNRSDRNGITPLHIGVYYQDTPLVEFLLASGAEPDLCTHGGFTPLHIATYQSSLDIIKKLLGTKAVDLNRATTEDEYTPTHIAVRFSNNIRILETLIASGANINKQSRLGRTPLHLAVIRGNVPAIQLLLKKGALVNTFSKQSDSDVGGKTPLDDALDKGNIEIIKLLKSYGAQSGITSIENSLSFTRRCVGYQLAQAADYLTQAEMR